ncbi:hypothetical protein N7528_006921 [Penicillium herquei]|nr:hypothetical protein N7528_006921 [Penicillium herquei]
MSTETMKSQSTSTKPTKLKASCDFCALSKLKCDRGQPQCRRCVKSGIMCHYSETRRVGKTRQIYAASHAHTTSPTTQGTGLANQTSNSTLQQKPTGQMSSGTRRMSNNRNPTQVQCGSSYYAMPMNLFDNFLSQDPMSITTSPSHIIQHGMHPYMRKTENTAEAFPSPESPNGFLQNLVGGMEMGDVGYVHDLQFDEEQEQDQDQGWDLSTSGNFSFGDNAADCIKRASTILQTLQVSRTCTNSDDRPSNSVTNLDVTLKNNRVAMDAVREILNCPCSRGMNVALLLVLITHQGMESYQRLLVQLQSGSRSPCNCSGSEGNCQGLVYDVPLAIGGYLLDEEMRIKVIAQVIRSELEKMGSLLDTLAEYTEGMRTQPDETVLKTFIESVRAGRSNILHSLDS